MKHFIYIFILLTLNTYANSIIVNNVRIKDHKHLVINNQKFYCQEIILHPPGIKKIYAKEANTFLMEMLFEKELKYVPEGEKNIIKLDYDRQILPILKFGYGIFDFINATPNKETSYNQNYAIKNSLGIWGDLISLENILNYRNKLSKDHGIRKPNITFGYDLSKLNKYNKTSGFKVILIILFVIICFSTVGWSTLGFFTGIINLVKKRKNNAEGSEKNITKE